MVSLGLADAFIVAFETISDPFNFFLILIAVLLGLFMGMLPGMGGTVTLALLIPLTFALDPIVAFMVLTAALGGTNFGGSVTAILVNTPGSSPNAATLLDGYPMARKGEGGRAISASAVASAFGAFFGILVFLITLPFLMEIIVLFGPPEIVWLGIWGLTVIAVIVKGGVIPGLLSAGMGLLFMLHGLNIHTANARWTYGILELSDGVKLIPALIGLFAIAEMIKLVSEGGSIANDEANTGDENVAAKADSKSQKFRGFKDVFVHKYLFIRSAIIGAIIGIIPGVGGTAANYIAYFQAMQTSKDSEKFGTGDVRGVIASEASNDAKDGTGFLPTLGLGIPGSAAMAVLLGAFILHGITPGPMLIEGNLDIVTVIIVTLVISNILTSTIGILTAEKLVYITKLDARILAPIVLMVSFFGTFALNNNIFDIWLALAFGILGFVMIKLSISRIPMILALVLGPIVEENFFRSLQISRGDYMIFLESGLSKLFLLLVLISLFLPYIRSTIQKRVLS